jgi:hypothetical protein
MGQSREHRTRAWGFPSDVVGEAERLDDMFHKKVRDSLDTSPTAFRFFGVSALFVFTSALIL